MGTFTHPITLIGPAGQRRTIDALVDTGSTFTSGPRDVLLDLDVEARREVRLRLADGTSHVQQLGRVLIQLNGVEEVTFVVFGEPESPATIGAVTLETLLLGIDPVGKRLVPIEGWRASADVQKRQRSEARVRYWGREYLASTSESCRLARKSFRKGDFFTAYLYLFVAFNNLYCLIARFGGREQEKIRRAVEKIRLDRIDAFYTTDYVERIKQLNDGPPVHFTVGLDAGALVEGIANMRDYFLGKLPADCVARVDQVASEWAPDEQKLSTLQEVAACLLYTIRNNQFHAVKGAQNLGDQTTLQTAYRILDPIVDSLMTIGREVVEGFHAGSSHP